MKFRRWALAGLALALVHCTNDPYPEADAGLRVRYVALPNPLKTLDPGKLNRNPTVAIMRVRHLYPTSPRPDRWKPRIFRRNNDDE